MLGSKWIIKLKSGLNKYEIENIKQSITDKQNNKHIMIRVA